MIFAPGDTVKSTTGLFKGNRQVIHVYERGWLLLDGPGLCERIARVEYVQRVPVAIPLPEPRVWAMACRPTERHPGKRLELARRDALKPHRAKCAPSEREILEAAMGKFDSGLKPCGTGWRKQRVAVGKWDGARQEMVVQAIASGKVAIILPGQGEPERPRREPSARTQQRIAEMDAAAAFTGGLEVMLGNGETRESFIEKLVAIGAGRGIAREAIEQKANEYAAGN